MWWCGDSQQLTRPKWQVTKLTNWGGAYGVNRCVAPVLLVNACHRDIVPLEFAFLLITAQSWDGIGLFCSPQTHDWAWGLLSLLWALSTFCDGALASRKSCERRILKKQFSEGSEQSLQQFGFLVSRSFTRWGKVFKAWRGGKTLFYPVLLCFTLFNSVLVCFSLF